MPSQKKPAEHTEQDVRVVLVPPCVKEPALHSLHTEAPAVLQVWSSPHAVCTPVPSQKKPAEHTEQDVRVVLVPPCVKEPALHTPQALCSGTV